MSRVAMMVKLPAAPGKGNEMAAALDVAIGHTMKESGTRYYISHADASNPDVIWMYELYDTQADADAHSGSDWFKEWMPSVGPLLGGKPEFISLRPLNGKGL